ncbi:MAG: hypothetical protein HYS51_02215 [Candidatus Zambryskibacteria bacterium]|nr:hypothetical protein [Candidatus Zambryskibacteria bacterium]QQG46445.1 MAG: hypothetical protein HYY55_01195 [Candidatus Niyogibacteria bacterium]
MPNKRRRGGGRENPPPSIVPLLTLGYMGECALFPGDVYIPEIFSVGMNVRAEAYKEYRQALVDTRWAIVVPILRDEHSMQHLGVGTLARLRSIRMQKDGNMSFQVKGVFRVSFAVYGANDKYAGAPFYKWEKKAEFPISKYEASQDEFHAALDMFQKNFEEFRQTYDLDSFLGETAFYQNAHSYMENLTPDTVALAVDSVMNLFNQMKITTASGEPVPLTFPSSVILQEERVFFRLKRMVLLLNDLLSIYNKETEEPIEYLEDTQEEPEKQGAKDLSSPEKKIDIKEPVSTEREKQMAREGLRYLEDQPRIQKEHMYKRFEEYYQEIVKKRKEREKKEKES